jgi:hypothetical protein
MGPFDAFVGVVKIGIGAVAGVVKDVVNLPVKIKEKEYDAKQRQQDNANSAILERQKNANDAKQRQQDNEEKTRLKLQMNEIERKKWQQTNENDFKNRQQKNENITRLELQTNENDFKKWQQENENDFKKWQQDNEDKTRLELQKNEFAATLKAKEIDKQVESEKNKFEAILQWQQNELKNGQIRAGNVKKYYLHNTQTIFCIATVSKYSQTCPNDHLQIAATCQQRPV